MGVVLCVHRLQNQIEAGDFTARSRRGGWSREVKNAVAYVEVKEQGGGGNQLI